MATFTTKCSVLSAETTDVRAVAGPVSFALALLVLTGCASQTPAGDPEVNTGGPPAEAPEPTIPVLQLEVGTCLNDLAEPLGADLTEIPSVDCQVPHESEVFAELTLEGTGYPGVDQIVDDAIVGCEAAFVDFVGIDFALSQLNFHYYYPTPSSWAVGDRSVYCVVFDPAEDTVGSLKGQAR